MFVFQGSLKLGVWTRRFGLIVVGLVAFGAILAKTGEKSMAHLTEIAATVEMVWAVFVDIGAYPEWNRPFRVREGGSDEGALVYEFRDVIRAIFDFPALVAAMDAPRSLHQVGGVFGPIGFDHRHALVLVDGGVRVDVSAVHGGAMADVWDPAAVGETHARLSEALKARVEGLKRLEM